jgi:hypothetical protein
MLEMLRKKLIDAGIDPAVGSMDYWGTELEGVLLDMYDLGAASERQISLVDKVKKVMSKRIKNER